MCGVFFINDDFLEELKITMLEVDRRLDNLYWSHDIHPSQTAPVIAAGRDGLRLTSQIWGYPGIRNKGVIFNARAETVQEKRMFQSGIRYHRAVIPASHFYEWNSHREKNIFYGKGKQPLYLAAFYDMIDNEERFIILTTQANESMIKTHDRMPLLLKKEQISDWIYQNKDTAAILRQKPDQLERQSDYEQMTLF